MQMKWLHGIRYGSVVGATMLWVGLSTSCGVAVDDEAANAGGGGQGGAAWAAHEEISQDSALLTGPSSATACTSGPQCPSGFCVDGVCCDKPCDNVCQACTAAKKGNGVDGTCGYINNDLDPDNECYAGACDGKGACRFYNGVACSQSGKCLSKFCVDGVCCGNACTGTCQACTAAKKGSGYDGVCESIEATRDPDNECSWLEKASAS